MNGLEEQMERRIAVQQDAAHWDRRYVSSLLDIAHDYVDKGEMDLAQHYVDEAKRYDNGAYKRFIEETELHLLIGRVFAECDKEQIQKQRYEGCAA